MAFTTALYYPSIDIMNEGWLKNAILYWDKIYTIVPQDIEQPYRSETSHKLNEEGILLPLYINKSRIDGEYMAKNFFEYIDSHEGKEFWASGEGSRDEWYIHITKVPKEILDKMEERKYLEVISKDKDIEEKLTGMFRGNEWIRMDKNVARFYMTLLAAYLSDEYGYGLLTDMASTDRLANAVRRDANLRPANRSYYFRKGGITRNLAEGTLADLILGKLGIDPNTPVEKIIDFRNEHDSQLGRFRNKLGELTKEISKEDMSSERFVQNIHDIYLNDVKPSIDDLKDSLKFNNISWKWDGLLKITAISVGPTSLATGLLGLSVPQAIIAMAGLSLAATLVNYNKEKENKLRREPYSYVLALRELG